MKIAVWHNLPSGGGKRALYDHVRGLVERGHTVESWCPSTADQTYLPLSELIKEHIVPFSWKPSSAKNRVTDIADSYRDVAHMIDAMDRHCRECADQINRGNFDLLFANTCGLLHVSSIGRHVNAPKILYLQEPCRYLYEARPQEPYRSLSASNGGAQLPWIALPEAGTSRFIRKVKRFSRDFMQMQGWRLQAREEWLSAKAFDVILVNSYFSRESVLRSYGLNAKVCYLGIDIKKFVYRNQARENFIVGLGAILSHKNIEFVIEALAGVSAPVPKFLWIGNIGNQSYLQELMAYAEGLGVNFEVRVRVSDDELVDILNRTMMMVYAPRLEPFGFAPLEANACGSPVVAVAEGGVRETIVNGLNGVLVNSEARTMAGAIENLMNNHAYARELGENGVRLVAEQWSVASAIDRLEDKFAELLNTPPQDEGRADPLAVSSHQLT
jgi:glycosyltransferase involved in cell wall biosynthesis